MKTVLSLGAGVQSSTLLLLACRGELPKPDHVVFSDTQFEPPEVYAHLEWLKDEAAKAGITIDTVTVGSIKRDAIDFARRRGRGDVSRYASIPFYVANNDGTQGMMPRQCTKEYKLEAIDKYHRRTVLGLKPGQRAPKEPAVRVLIGISDDERHRAKPPGWWASEQEEIGENLFGGAMVRKRKVWKPVHWQVRAYPLLNVEMWPDQSVTDWDVIGGIWTRADCVKWLEKNFPGRKVPKSACICCPYRSDAEWIHMRETDPETFAEAVSFDHEIREAYRDGQARRGFLAGVPYTHRTMVPLEVVEFDPNRTKRKGCGALWDEEPDGMCGL